MAITDFLNTQTPKEKLAAALEVLREFKGHESQEEWLMIPFAAWDKLEQMEEFLAHLVDGEELKDDTKEYIANQRSTNAT